MPESQVQPLVETAMRLEFYPRRDDIGCEFTKRLNNGQVELPSDNTNAFAYDDRKDNRSVESDRASNGVQVRQSRTSDFVNSTPPPGSNSGVRSTSAESNIEMSDLSDTGSEHARPSALDSVVEDSKR